MTVTAGRTREKRYGALFTCLATRAIHLQLTHSLDTGSMFHGDKAHGMQSRPPREDLLRQWHKLPWSRKRAKTRPAGMLQRRERETQHDPPGPQGQKKPSLISLGSFLTTTLRVSMLMKAPNSPPQVRLIGSKVNFANAYQLSRWLSREKLFFLNLRYCINQY